MALPGINNELRISKHFRRPLGIAQRHNGIHIPVQDQDRAGIGGNMLIVINAYNNLKANTQDESYKKSFAAGMVTGGNGIINTVNATSIINGLLNSSALEGTNATNIANNVQTVSTIIQLLGALK